MAGYADDFSMSNNAIDAYDRGLRPRSKWSKADILDALSAEARTYLKLDEYPLEFLREYFLEVEEWHHTSKHYNRTDFCRPSIAHWSTSTPEDVQNLYIVWLQRQKKAQAMKTTDTRKVRVTYTHTGSTSTPTRPSPSMRSFADPGSTRKAVYASAPTAPTSASMRPTSAPPEGQPRSSRKSNAA